MYTEKEKLLANISNAYRNFYTLNKFLKCKAACASSSDKCSDSCAISDHHTSIHHITVSNFLP